MIILNQLESYKLNYLTLPCTVLDHMFCFFFYFGIENFLKYIFRITAIEDLFILVCTNIDFGLVCLTNCDIATLLKGSHQHFMWNYKEGKIHLIL